MTADGEQLLVAPRRGGGTLRLVVLMGVLAALVLGAGHAGILPTWVPMRTALLGPEPAAPAVQYPVFGSDEFVTYLAASMIAQEGSINVAYWAGGDDVGRDGVFDAMTEASIQNPYVYIDGWTYVTTVAGAVIRPDYAYSAIQAEQRREATAASVTAGLVEAGVTQGQPVEDKVRAIHDYIASVATYDQDAADAITAGITDGPQVEQSQEAYGILVAGSAVCNGYAQAFQAMAQAAGVPAIIVTGEASSGVTVGPHAWNKVLVDGQWLVVDVTWDDADAWGIQEEYLLVKPGDSRLDTRTEDLDWVVDDEAAQYGV